MTEDEIIDKWAKLIAGRPDGFYADRLFYPNQTLHGDDSRKFRILLGVMEREKIIESAIKPNSSLQRFWYKKGNKFAEIIAAGGWIEYKKKRGKEEVENVKEKKLQGRINKLDEVNKEAEPEHRRFGKKHAIYMALLVTATFLFGIFKNCS